VLISNERILIKKNDTDSIYFIKNESDEWEKNEIDNEKILHDFGLIKKRIRNTQNVIENFTKNFNLWKRHSNSSLEYELKSEVVWKENKECRENIILGYIDSIHNNGGNIVNNYSLYRNFKSLEIYKDLYKLYGGCSDEKSSRRVIQKLISTHVGNSFAEKLFLRFSRFCDVSPFCGDAWWSICSIPISHWTIPSSEEWNKFILYLKSTYNSNETTMI
jgi:hypothetical protein